MTVCGCCCYHKGRNFQANHNDLLPLHYRCNVVVATTKVGIFKQITTRSTLLLCLTRCCCYHKGRNFQANHNCQKVFFFVFIVVVATTKVGIFKQITTNTSLPRKLFCCCCYHKGRNFQANHN